ncbi:hypothetical protein ABIB27_002879 [Arthrobacter sp. UYEF21]
MRSDNLLKGQATPCFLTQKEELQISDRLSGGHSRLSG